MFFYINRFIFNFCFENVNLKIFIKGLLYLKKGICNFKCCDIFCLVRFCVNNNEISIMFFYMCNNLFRFNILNDVIVLKMEIF